MIRTTQFFTLVFAGFLLNGCATIVSGTTQKVPVTSIPSGAMAKVDGNLAALTPTIFTLDRKSDHTIEISKEGYRTSQVLLRRAMNGMTAGNILVGGIIGAGVDAMSGSMYKLVPERVDVTLQKEGEIEIPVAVEQPAVTQAAISQETPATEAVIASPQVTAPVKQ